MLDENVNCQLIEFNNFIFENSIMSELNENWNFQIPARCVCSVLSILSYYRLLIGIHEQNFFFQDLRDHVRKTHDEISSSTTSPKLYM